MDHPIILWYDTVAIVFAFFVGAAIGSGIMCLLMRRAQKRTWLKARPTCDHCGHKLAWYDLVPILSYAFRNGRCRYCGAQIPASCISAEVIYGLMGVVCAVTIMSTASPVAMRLGFLIVAAIATLVYTAMSNNIIKEREAKRHG